MFQIFKYLKFDLEFKLIRRLADKNFKLHSAFTLIEVLVFVSILELFFVMAAAVSVASLRNIKTNEHKLLATKHAEDLVEWLRSEKENDWDTFVAKADGSVYCFNDPITDIGETIASQAAGACAGYNGLTGIAPVIFKREATLTRVGSPAYQVNVQVNVTWVESNITYSVPVSTVFSVWEQ